MTIICNSEPTHEEVLRLVEQSGTLAFWDDASEEVYSLKDGEPIERTTSCDVG